MLLLIKMLMAEVFGPKEETTQAHIMGRMDR